MDKKLYHIHNYLNKHQWKEMLITESEMQLVYCECGACGYKGNAKSSVQKPIDNWQRIKKEDWNNAGTTFAIPFRSIVSKLKRDWRLRHEKP